MIAPTSSKTLDEYNNTLPVARLYVLNALILTDAFNCVCVRGGGIINVPPKNVV